MTISTTLNRVLTQDEKEALSHYGADSTFLHAVAQGRASDFQHDPDYAAFWPRAAAIAGSLDSAIGASTLDHDSTLYASHGSGFGVRGALIGPPKQFLGLSYLYPGFISTTSDAAFRDRFLEKRRRQDSRPTILELRLPAGFTAVDMRHGNHAGEFEFLLGRSIQFQIVDASAVDTDVLVLGLSP